MPKLRDLGHEIIISSFYGLQGSAVPWNGIRVWPCDIKGYIDAAGSEIPDYGAADLRRYALHWTNNDPSGLLVLTLMDVWALPPQLIFPLPLASWVPIDHHDVQVHIRDFFEATGSIPIAMSRFGETELTAAGLDPLYVPHGVDTEILMPRDRAEARDRLGLPREAFVVGMVSANQGVTPVPRKAFPQAFKAFNDFARNHRDAILYLHTFPDRDPDGRNGIDIRRELSIYPDISVAMPNPTLLKLGLGYEQMSYVYSAFDVLLCPSYGEGFGIPIVEAQACGVPVIVNDFSAMPELCGAGWKVEGQMMPIWQQGGLGGEWQMPAVESIANALLDAYDGVGVALSSRARDFALGFDTRKITEEYWVPALGEIEKRISPLWQALADGKQEYENAQVEAGKRMPGAALNRKQRRRAARAA